MVCIMYIYRQYLLLFRLASTIMMNLFSKGYLLDNNSFNFIIFCLFSCSSCTYITYTPCMLSCYSHSLHSATSIGLYFCRDEAKKPKQHWLSFFYCAPVAVLAKHFRVSQSCFHFSALCFVEFISVSTVCLFNCMPEYHVNIDFI